MNEEKQSEEYPKNMALEKEVNGNEPQPKNIPATNDISSNLKDELLNYVARSKAIFKSQQKDDPDLSFEEKWDIAKNILNKSHCLFLSKFGQHLKQEHLKYFDENKDYEVSYHITRLQRYFNNSMHHIDVKNKRYMALRALIEKGEYFSESEMMKRNPLLYEHLVGQYLTEDQKKARDNIDSKNITFVNILMESIERNSLRELQKLQQEEEDNVLEENESDEEDEDTDELSDDNSSIKQPNCSQGKLFESGEVSNEEKDVSSDKMKQLIQPWQKISSKEKQMLKQEFVTNMYQSFLEGKDPDFDYSTVDDNEAYDNLDLRTQDEEERYFDSESPETIIPSENLNQSESEDELEIYMKSLKVK